MEKPWYEPVARRIEDVATTQSVRDLFRDLIHCMFVAIRNETEIVDDAWREREAEYLEIVRIRGRAVIDAFTQTLGDVALAYMKDDRDALGELYGRLGLTDAKAGMILTPIHAAKMMASLALDERATAATVAETGFVRLLDPASGTGVFPVAAAWRMKQLGYDPTRHLHVRTIERDETMARMAWVAMAMNGIPGEVVHGDSATGEQHDVWTTPSALPPDRRRTDGVLRRA